jgi:hypothetical protein
LVWSGGVSVRDMLEAPPTLSLALRFCLGQVKGVGNTRRDATLPNATRAACQFIPFGPLALASNVQKRFVH